MNHSSADLIPILYKRYAKAWQKMREESPFVEKAWLDRLIDQVKMNIHDKPAHVLDLGCGFGKPIAGYLIEHGLNITGVDITKRFIKTAKKSFKDHTWIHADMRAFHIDGSFDGIIAWDSFFHLTRDEQIKMFNQFEKYAKPGAPLMFTSGFENGEAIGDFNGYDLYHSSLSTDEYRKLLIDHGFGLITYKVQDQTCGGRTIWLAKRRS